MAKPIWYYISELKKTPLENYPQDFWAKLRGVNGELRNAKYFLDNYFKSGVHMIPEYLTSLNYKVKYLYTDETGVPIANSEAFNGTRYAKVKDWLTKRLHFLDVMFNVQGINKSIKESIVIPSPLQENKNAAATTVGLFHFPLIIGLPGTKQSNDNGYPTIMFGLRKPSLIVDIYNKGAVATGIRIVFKATATIKNPSLINVDTQQYFKINKTMVAGEEVVIDTNVGKKKIRGYLNGVEYNYFKYIDFGSKWLQLEVGDNLFRYDAEENMNGLEVYIYYYDRFLEVQGCN